MADFLKHGLFERVYWKCGQEPIQTQDCDYILNPCPVYNDELWVRTFSLYIKKIYIKENTCEKLASAVVACSSAMIHHVPRVFPAFSASCPFFASCISIHATSFLAVLHHIPSISIVSSTISLSIP